MAFHMDIISAEDEATGFLEGFFYPQPSSSPEEGALSSSTDSSSNSDLYIYSAAPRSTLQLVDTDHDDVRPPPTCSCSAHCDLYRSYLTSYLLADAGSEHMFFYCCTPTTAAARNIPEQLCRAMYVALAEFIHTLRELLLWEGSVNGRFAWFYGHLPAAAEENRIIVTNEQFHATRYAWLESDRRVSPSSLPRCFAVYRSMYMLVLSNCTDPKSTVDKPRIVSVYSTEARNFASTQERHVVFRNAHSCHSFGTSVDGRAYERSELAADLYGAPYTRRGRDIGLQSVRSEFQALLVHCLQPVLHTLAVALSNAVMPDLTEVYRLLNDNPSNFRKHRIRDMPYPARGFLHDFFSTLIENVFAHHSLGSAEALPYQLAEQVAICKMRLIRGCVPAVDMRL